jgi:hypothetical protein
MKKAMISLLCTISVLVSISFIYYQKSHDNERLDNIELNGDAIKFYIKDSTVTTKQEVNEFKKLSQKYDATFIRTDKLFKKNQEIIYKSGVFSKDYFQNSKIKLSTGQLPKNSNQTLATFDTKSKLQTGVIYDLFSDYQVIMQPLDTFYKNNISTTSGNYTLIVSTKQKAPVLQQLSKFYGISTEKLLQPFSESAYGEGTVFLLAVILSIIVFAIFCLMNVFYPISKLKEIGVMKLQGIKSTDIWKDLNRQILLIPLGFFLITMLIQKIIIKQTDLLYFGKLIALQSIIFVLCLFFSLLMLIFIRGIKLSALLKNFFNFRFSLYFSYVLKFIVFVGLVFIIPMMSKQLNDLSQELKIKHVYQNESHYLTLASVSYVDDEMQSFLNGEDKVGVKLTKLYKELEKTADCQYVVTENIRPATFDNNYKGKYSKVSFSSNDSYTLMQANQNYLKGLDIQFPTSLDEAFDSNTLTFFAPKSLEKSEKKIEFLARDKAASMLEKDNTNTLNLDKLPVKIIWYSDNDKEIFSENIDLSEENSGFVKNPIILCLSDRFFTQKNSMLSNSALYNPIRILNTKKNDLAIQKAIISAGLERNSIKFGNVVSTGFAQKLQLSKTSMVAWVSIIILAILVSILASYYIILIILTSKKKYMLVSRLLGYSLIERYQTEIYYFSAVYIFGLVEIFILSRNVLSICSYLLMVAFDSSIIYFMVKRREKSSLNLELKGEE